MEKIILEIERQIERLQAAKKLLQDTKELPLKEMTSHPTLVSNGAPVKRGRGRPRKHPLPVSSESAA